MIIGIDASRVTTKTPTGVEMYADAIVRAMLPAISESHHEIRLYTRDSLPKDLFVPANVRIKRIRCWRLWTQIGLSLEMFFHKIDVLFIPAHVLPLVRPKKSIVTIHDLAFMRFPEAYSKFARWYLQWSTKYAVKHALKLIVPSQATADDLQKFFHCPAEKIVVIPHGFHVPETPSRDFIAGLLDKLHLHDPYIIFVGRLETKKNLHRFIDAFATFRNTHPQWKLVLVGTPGAGYAKINYAIHHHGVQAHVKMMGYRSDSEKYALLHAAHVLAIPSLAEGFGFPVLEGFASKVPVLISRTPALLEVAGDAALSVDSDDPAAMAETLQRLADDEPLRQRLIAKGHQRLADFSWEKAGKTTWAVLNA